MNKDDPILHECRRVLESFYGDRLKGIVLYGSSARGTDTEESDIDLLILLEGPVDVVHEIRRIWHELYPVQLESDRLISIMPADAERYGEAEYSLYREVQSHGIPI